MKKISKKVSLAAVAIIRDDEGRILLTRRAIPPYLGKWVMPGGKVTEGESVLEALKREVLEEVGLEVSVRDLLDVYEIPTNSEHYHHFVVLYFSAHHSNRKVIPNHKEVSEVVWADPGMVKTLDMPTRTRLVLSKVFGLKS